MGAGASWPWGLGALAICALMAWWPCGLLAGLSCCAIALMRRLLALACWLPVSYAAHTRTSRVKEPDVRPAYQRARGTEASVRLLPFGEICPFKWRCQEKGIGGSARRWSTGIWLGIERCAGQYMVYDSALGWGGEVRPHSDANARVAEVAI